MINGFEGGNDDRGPGLRSFSEPWKKMTLIADSLIHAR